MMKAPPARFAAVAIAVLAMAASTMAHTDDRDTNATNASVVRFISPAGNDAANGLTPATALKTFSHAFGSMDPGDELVLLAGRYSDAANTGIVHYQGSNSAQPPSGSAGQPTRIRAEQPGTVTIEGPLFLGRSFRKDSHIVLEGLTFEGGGALYNTSFVTLRNCGFHGGLSVGTNDLESGTGTNLSNTDNLIEDVWIWATGKRIIAINYRAKRNVWRRVIVRGDGCGTAACSGSGNPNVGFTVYDSSDVSVQNMIILDRVLAPTDSPYADFAVAQHTADPLWYLGRTEWLGTMSLYSPDLAYYMEPDTGQTIDPTIRIVNAVAFGARSGGFNLARYGTNNHLENLLAHVSGGDAIRIAPDLGALQGVVRNALVFGDGRYAINSSYGADYVNVDGSWSQGPFNQVTPSNIVPGSPLGNGSLRYLPRIEADSPLAQAGLGGSPIGVRILNRIGTSGTRFGQPGYNAIGTEPLWPWPNEARIKAEMCTETMRGFCSTGLQLDGVNPVTLSSYVWEALGNPIPESIYGGSGLLFRNGFE